MPMLPALCNTSFGKCHFLTMAMTPATALSMFSVQQIHISLWAPVVVEMLAEGVIT